MTIQGVTSQMSAPVLGNTATSPPATGMNGSSSTGTGGLSADNLQSTFLNLLVTELQNQDPTQPVDPTEMVSQMVSLNQLDQLISINQTLATMDGTSAASGDSITRIGANADRLPNSSTTGEPLVAGSSAASNTAVMPQPSLFNSVIPGGLMNLYGNIGSPKLSSSAIPGGK